MTGDNKHNPSDLVTRLREVAESNAEDRRVAEFGPAGGNPDAKAEQHIEWGAAEYIEKLNNQLADMREIISSCSRCAEDMKLMSLTARDYQVAYDWRECECHPKPRKIFEVFDAEDFLCETINKKY